MPDIFHTNYQSISDMDQEVAPASWKKFYVIEAGRTNGAHETIVQKICRTGRTEVFSPEDSDFLLIFCPVASRVGTDISEALQDIPAGKPVILVVMHHTFNPHHVVADSRRQVDNPNVYLTVDCLFYEGRFLTSKRNDIAWSEIQKFLGIPVFPDSFWQSLCPIWFISFCSSIHQYFLVVCLCLTSGCRNHWMWITIGITVVVGMVVIVTIIILEQQKMI